MLVEVLAEALLIEEEAHAEAARVDLLTAPGPAHVRVARWLLAARVRPLTAGLVLVNVGLVADATLAR